MKLFRIITLFCVSGVIALALSLGSDTARAAGWQDPWAGGSGFDDPFAAKKKPKKQEEGTAGQEKQGKRGKQDSSAKSRLGGLEPPAGMNVPDRGPTREEILRDSELKKKRLDALIENRKQARKAIPEKESDAYDNTAFTTDNPALLKEMRRIAKLYEEMNAKRPQALTPYGGVKGQEFAAARQNLVARFFVEGGRCNDGEMFYRDPVNICVGIFLRGQAEARGLPGEKLTDASVWLSKECLKDDPSLAYVKEFIEASDDFREYKDGWSSGNLIEGCLAAVSKMPDAAVPPFLGQVNLAGDKTIAHAILTALGAKVVREYQNGYEMRLDGSRIWLEYCPESGTIVSVSMDVGKETPRVADYIDAMGLKRENVEFRSVRFRAVKGQNGRFTKLEFFMPDAEYRCKAGKA